MYKIELSLEIHGPAPNTNKRNLMGAFTKNIELSFVPFPGLRLDIEREHGLEMDKIYDSTFNKVSNVTGLFIVKDVYHFVRNKKSANKSRADFEIVLAELYEDTAESFNLLKEFLRCFEFQEIPLSI